MLKPDLGMTFRSASGNRRVTYRPDYSTESPWVSYYKGTAGIHFKDLDSAMLFHRSIYDPLITKEKSL